MAMNFNRGLFGPPSSYQTPGIGDGLPNAQPQPDPGLGFPGAAPPQKKSGFFGEGGVGRGIAGALGDALMQLGGLRPTFGPLMQQRQTMAYQEKMRQQSRADDWQDWQKQQQWKIDHPELRQPHYWETNDGSLGMIGADGQPKILYKDPTPKIDWITANNPDGTKTLVPMSRGGLVTGTPAPASSAFEPDVILNNAKQSGMLSPQDYDFLQGQLGPNGKTALDGWLTGSKVKVAQQIDGKTYYRINGKWYDNPEGN